MTKSARFTPRFVVALWLGKIAAGLIDRFFPSRGSNQAGKIACRIMPDLLGGFSGIDPSKTVLITGSNGKSTSNNLVVHAFRTAGRSVATNLEGANLATGVATALIKNADWRGRLTTEFLILEVDERSLQRVRAAIPARYLCVTNIQKDQVQRNGDPDYIYQKVLAAVGDDVTVFVNNEEPRSASLARAAGQAIRFSVAPNQRRSLPETDGFAVTMPCPVCHDALVFDWYNLGGVGRFSCPSCDFHSADEADYTVDAVDFAAKTFAVNGQGFHLQYDAQHFLYNYALCCAVAGYFGIGTDDLTRAFSTFSNVGGRLEDFPCGRQRVRYLRMKQENPETVQSAIDTIAADPGPKVLLLGLETIGDIIPHYTNTAYVFDCTFQGLFSGDVEACICFGQPTCYDVATRLIYAGFPADKIKVVESNSPADIFTAMAEYSSQQSYLLTWLSQYEAMRKYADRRPA